jgi:hypothetical protein
VFDESVGTTLEEFLLGGYVLSDYQSIRNKRILSLNSKCIVAYFLISQSPQGKASPIPITKVKHKSKKK